MSQSEISQFDAGLRADAEAPEQADYVLAPDVLLIPVEDGSARLVDLGGGVYSLSEVAAMMLDIMVKRGSAAAVAEVSRHFSADAALVQKDLDELLAEFQKKKLVRKHGDSSRVMRRRRQMVAQAQALVLPLICRGPLPLKLKAWSLLLAARVSCATAGWAATVRAWKNLNRQTTAAAATEGRLGELDRAVRAMAARHLFRVECKERALSCWALARAAGAPAELVVGIQLFPVCGHCWCEVGPTTLSDERCRINDFRPVARWQ